MAEAVVATARLTGNAADTYGRPGSGRLSIAALGIVAGVLLGFDTMATLDMLLGTGFFPHTLLEPANANLTLSVGLLVLCSEIASSLGLKSSPRSASDAPVLHTHTCGDPGVGGLLTRFRAAIIASSLAG